MPSYDYRCASCDAVFEEFQRITAEPGATCPECGSDQCTRLISGGTFHLKGSGWYASDYGGAGRSGTASTQQAAQQAAQKAAPSANASVKGSASSAGPAPAVSAPSAAAAAKSAPAISNSTAAGSSSSKGAGKG